jgi:hypothetical protein
MSNKVESIALEGVTAPVVFAAKSALTTRDELLKAAKVVTTVTDAESAEQAIDMLRQLKEFSDKIELSRKEVKAPIDLIVSKIQETARVLVTDITTERQKALAEEQRVIDEQNKKIADAQAAGASDKKLEKLEAKAFEQIAEAKQLTAATAAPKFAGVATRPVWVYEVTDFAALYKAHPTAVKMEPVDAIVKALLKQTKGVLPGVTAHQENRAIVR